MKKVLKILLIVGVSLLLFGGAVFGIAIAAAGGDLSALATREVKTETYTETFENPIRSVQIDFCNATIEIRLEDTQTLSIDYPQILNKKGKYTTEVKLTETQGAISINEKQLWQYNLFNIQFDETKIVLHLPKDRVYALDLSTDNGSIKTQGEKLQASSLSFELDNGGIETDETEIVCEGEMRLETDNGGIRLGMLSCSDLYTETDNGQIYVADGNVNGNAVFDVDNGSIVIEGNFRANSFKANVDNGKIQANHGCIFARHIHLEINVGNINATLAGAREDYTVDVETDVGSTNILSGGNGENTLTISSDVGDIEINFAD